MTVVLVGAGAAVGAGVIAWFWRGQRAQRRLTERLLARPAVETETETEREASRLPRNRLAKGARAGDRVVLVGGRTGRDGIHGATFSSSALTQSHAEEFAHAVQIGNAIEEKKVMDASREGKDAQNKFQEAYSKLRKDRAKIIAEDMTGFVWVIYQKVSNQKGNGQK